jgi:hypothetical protein
MFDLPYDIQACIYEYDSTFRTIYSECISHFKTLVAQKLFRYLENTSNWDKVHFWPKKITYTQKNSRHVIFITEINNGKQYRLTDYNIITGAFRIHLIDL